MATEEQKTKAKLAMIKEAADAARKLDEKPSKSLTLEPTPSKAGL